VPPIRGAVLVLVLSMPKAHVQHASPNPPGTPRACVTHATRTTKACFSRPGVLVSGEGKGVGDGHASAMPEASEGHASGMPVTITYTLT